MEVVMAAEQAVPLDEFVGLSPTTIAWDEVYLDPHNPRLTELELGEEPVKVPDKDIPNEELQADLLGRLRNKIGIDDLVDKMKKLGFLTIDRIVVRPLVGTAGYVVLEGNRRVAAVRSMMSNPKLLLTLDQTVRESFKSFEVLVYNGDNPDIAWELQGLRHIGGVKPWGPFQQARFLVEMQQRHGIPPADVAQIAGVGRTTAARLIRSYYGFIQAAQDEDFGDQIVEQDFSVFQEAIFHKKNSPIWDWLNWDDDSKRFEEDDKLGVLLGLLKDKADGDQPRIPRVNPDLRDKFSRVLGRPDVLGRFMDGELSLDGAVTEIVMEEGKKPPVESLVDLEAQIERLTEMQNYLITLPIPKIVQESRAGEFRDLLTEVDTTLQFQIEQLDASHLDPAAESA
jgi:hypothetical protein